MASSYNDLQEHLDALELAKPIKEDRLLEFAHMHRMKAVGGKALGTSEGTLS